MPFQLIHDNYTQTEEILGLTVTFRPVTAGEWDDFQGALEGASNSERRKMVAEAIAEHLATWDAEAGGETVEPTAANVQKLPAGVFSMLQDHVFGYVEPTTGRLA